MQEAEGIIRDEHRCLATVLNCVESLVRDVEEKGAEPDFTLLHLALEYISSFLYAFHHPKETGHLFPVVRRRVPSLAGVLDELEQQHHQGRELMEDLQAALEAYEKGEEGGFERFKQAVATYHKFEWAHMLKEEKAILPYACGCLTAADWGKIDAIFQDYVDPVFGTRRKEEFQALFDKIIGLGPIGFKPHHGGDAGR